MSQLLGQSCTNPRVGCLTPSFPNSWSNGGVSLDETLNPWCLKMQLPVHKKRINKEWVIILVVFIIICEACGKKNLRVHVASAVLQSPAFFYVLYLMSVFLPFLWHFEEHTEVRPRTLIGKQINSTVWERWSTATKKTSIAFDVKDEDGHKADFELKKINKNSSMLGEMLCNHCFVLL